MIDLYWVKIHTENSGQLQNIKRTLIDIPGEQIKLNHIKCSV